MPSPWTHIRAPATEEARAVSDMAKNLILWVVIAIVLMSVFNNFTATQSQPRTEAYSDFIDQVKQGQVKEVTIKGRTIDGLTEGEPDGGHVFLRRY